MVNNNRLKPWFLQFRLRNPLWILIDMIRRNMMHFAIFTAPPWFFWTLFKYMHYLKSQIKFVQSFTCVSFYIVKILYASAHIYLVCPLSASLPV